MRQLAERIVAGTAVLILELVAFADAADLAKATNDAEGRGSAAQSSGTA